MLVRFVSCGLLSLLAGGAWRLWRAPPRVTITAALADLLVLLAGFIVGGLLWYRRDSRIRRRSPERVTDERMVFSFVVFVIIPLAVLVLVAAVWLLSLMIGAA